MKNLISITVMLLILIISVGEARAQLWDKIKNKTKRKVENTISEKASDKAAEVAAKNMDRMLNADINPFEKGEKKDHSNLPNTYMFEKKYRVKVTSKASKKPMPLDYYLAPGNSYFGYSMPQMTSMFMVIDRKHDGMISYMEQGGQAVASVYSLSEGDGESEQETMDSFTVTELPDKEIIGFTAKGAQLENAHTRLIVYRTAEADIEFTNSFTSKKSKLSPKTKAYLDDKSNGLILYIQYFNKDDAKKNIKMEGVSLEETMLVGSNKNYSFSE